MFPEDVIFHESEVIRNNKKVPRAEYPVRKMFL
jgi:hypothetical protein